MIAAVSPVEPAANSASVTPCLRIVFNIIALSTVAIYARARVVIGVTLALFAAGSTGLTAAINELTKSTIDQQAALQQKALFDQVLPADRYNNGSCIAPE